MKAQLQFGLILFILFASVSMSLSDLSNPHLREGCTWGSCHIEDPLGGDILLLGESIDHTCCICHTEKCSLTEGTNHLSNIDQWDKNEFESPTSLPLYDGYITCMTCHYRSKPQGADYKMVRIVTLEGAQITWEDLCRDCHAHH
jgi:hypothetical protein